MIRAGLCWLLLAASPAFALDAAGYFRVGLDYLHKGFFLRAREAFAECVEQAPDQAVPIAFLGIAAAAEGRRASECAGLLRTAYARLPAKKTLRLDLRTLLPSPRALALLEADYERALKRKAGRKRDLLTVLAFLQVQDGSPRTAPALETLLKLDPKDAFAKALRKSADARPPPRKPAPAS